MTERIIENVNEVSHIRTSQCHETSKILLQAVPKKTVKKTTNNQSTKPDAKVPIAQYFTVR